MSWSKRAQGMGRLAGLRPVPVMPRTGFRLAMALMLAPAGVPASDDCVPVKAWEALDDPVRLCA